MAVLIYMAVYTVYTYNIVYWNWISTLCVGYYTVFYILYTYVPLSR